MNLDKMVWYGNRLRSMPPQEVAHRLKEAHLMHRHLPLSNGFTYPLWLSRTAPEATKLIDLWRTFWSAKVSDYCQERASEALAGRIQVFGHEWSTVEKNWYLDPVTGDEWPSIPTHRIDYRHSAGADPKWTWEINRLLYLLPVAFAVESNLVDRHKAEEFISATVSDWIAECVVGEGPQWSASIEVAIRSISMTLAIQAIKAPDKELLALVGASVQAHAAWIKRFPSRYSSANNHRVAEISALLLLDSNWEAILDDSERGLLESELLSVSRSLFAADGIGLEQSPTYAGFSLEFLSAVLRCHDWNDENARSCLARIVNRGAAAIAQFTNEDGSLIRYGDDDEGKVFTVGVPELEYSASIVRLATAKNIRRNYGLTSFVEGGVSILRYLDLNHETTWLFDHGPLGFGTIAAHGHADVLSVSLRTAGIDWIVDAGTYRYHGDKMWRTYFRSSRAHNAPQLNELDSSVMTGDFNWHPNKRAEGRIVVSQANGEEARIEATHDGYLKRGLGTVTRVLQRVGEAHYRISDSSRGDSLMSSAFMLNPSCTVTSRENGWHISYPNSPLSVQLVVSGQSELMLENPEDETAWYSPSFGQKLPTWRLKALAKVNHISHQQLIFDIRITSSIQED